MLHAARIWSQLNGFAGSILNWIQSRQMPAAVWEAAFQRPIGGGEVRSAREPILHYKEIMKIKRGRPKCFITNPYWRPQKGQICYLMILIWKKKKTVLWCFFSKQLHHGTGHTQQRHSFCGFIYSFFFSYPKETLSLPFNNAQPEY